VLALVFQWADDNKIPLLDLKDLKIVLNHLATTGKQDIAAEYWDYWKGYKWYNYS
jgi:hypothetical protein